MKKILLENIVKDSKSFQDLLKNLGYKKGSPQSSIREKIEKYNIDISHFDIIGNKLKNRNKFQNKDIFVEKSPLTRASIRNRIIRDSIIKYECELCQNKGEWLGQKMPLILDHISGINDDYRLENLRWLCSNCDSIQPTYKARNRKKNRKILIKTKRELVRENKIDKIINSNINFKEKGWSIKLSTMVGYTPQHLIKFIKINIPDLYLICFKHKK